MPSLHELLQLSAQRHRHLCPRQVLGVRMGILAGKLLSLDLPQTDKRLFTFIETDGCTLDGVGVSTGCWPGRRSMYIMDFGKIAATFIDTQTGSAYRIHPHPQARKIWRQYAPDQPNRWHGQLAAYQIMPDEELFVVQPVRLTVSLKKMISHAHAKAICAYCGEEIKNDRQVITREKILCRACAGEAYYDLSLTEGDEGILTLANLPEKFRSA